MKRGDGSVMMVGVGITAVSGLPSVIDGSIEGTFDVVFKSEGLLGKLWWNGASFVTSAWTGVGVMIFMSVVWHIKFRKTD